MRRRSALGKEYLENGSKRSNHERCVNHQPLSRLSKFARPNDETGRFRDRTRNRLTGGRLIFILSLSTGKRSRGRVYPLKRQNKCPKRDLLKAEEPRPQSRALDCLAGEQQETETLG